MHTVTAMKLKPFLQTSLNRPVGNNVVQNPQIQTNYL